MNSVPRVPAPLAERVVADRVRNVPPAGTRRFFDLAIGRNDIISLGIGEPDFTTPPKIVEAGVRSLRAGRTHYTSNYGTLDLRRSISEDLDRRYGVAYNPEYEILITVGASEALDAALRATCNPGDEIITHEPCYTAYGPVITFAGGVPVFLPTGVEHSFVIRPPAVEAAITPRTKALMLGYPSNPTGAVLSAAVQEELAEVANRNDLLVYSDEIYDHLVYRPHQHRPMSSFPGMRERTILIGGFSKTYAMTGWRLGYICAPAPLLEAIMRVHQYTITSASTTAQDAAVEALRSGEPAARRMVASYDRRRRLVVDALNSIGLPTLEPLGAFYAFPEITSTGLESNTFANRLLEEERVVVVAGKAFGPSGEGHIRICYAASEEHLTEALARIRSFVTRTRSRHRPS